MVLIWGIPSESPIRRLLDELDALGQPYVAVSQRHFADTDITLTMDATGNLGGTLTYQQQTYPLADLTGVYLRLVDDEVLPEYQQLATDDPLRTHVRRLTQLLTLWAEWSGCRMINRLAAMASNNSKPYQAQFIRQHGFLTPDTLITNDPEQAMDFCQRHNNRVIYKSISGVRSIVQAWNAGADREKLGLIRHCPVQFQEQVEGFDVRVHVIGELTLATRITAQATDYRYAIQQTGESAELTTYALDADVAANCVSLSRALELDFSGIDLRFAPTGEVYCFEVNPCPAYTYYESHTDQPIAARLAEYLTGHDNYYRRVWNVSLNADTIMAQTTFSLTKEEGGRTLHSETKADLSKTELTKLIAELKANGSPEFGEFATIYVAPENYTLHVNGQDIPLKPQFFPPEYGHIINELTSRLK